MKLLKIFFGLSLLLFIASCSNTNGSSSDERALSDASFGGESSSSSSGNGQGNNNQEGLITAAEWNDLDHWDFWTNLLDGEEFSDKASYWNFYTNNRVSLLVKNGIIPVVNAPVSLRLNGEIIWQTKTDNFGKAELWVSLFNLESNPELNDYQLFIDGQPSNQNLTFFEDGVNEIQTNATQVVSNKIELSFIVDATGSMGDELEFLKDDMEDVIQKVQNNNQSSSILTSCVFYRDVDDEYLIKVSDFTGTLSTSLDFISEQSAGGGGDFPEAVHTALLAGINDLQWSENAKTKIAFLVLDAPPHHELDVISDLQNTIRSAAAKGIKVIPITASGINKETEALMRFMSIATNSTYVFITNDSGIGNDHLEASVGEFEVEFLNDLMVRLINKYSE